jgi:hypothetical protein
MRISSVLFLALLATSTLHCQTLDKFYIGAFWVGGNATDTVKQPNPGSVATYEFQRVCQSHVSGSPFSGYIAHSADLQLPKTACLPRLTFNF